MNDLDGLQLESAACGRGQGKSLSAQALINGSAPCKLRQLSAADPIHNYYQLGLRSGMGGFKDEKLY